MKKKHLIILCATLIAAIIFIPLILLLLTNSLSFFSSPEEQLARHKESVKLVMKFRRTTNNDNSHFLACGSGFVINNKGTLITNARVVCADANNEVADSVHPMDVIYIVYETERQGRKYVVMQHANVDCIDTNRDLAVLSVDAVDSSNLKPLSIARTAIQGQNVRALGFPGAFDLQDSRLQIILKLAIEAIKNHSTLLTDRIELNWDTNIGDFLEVVTQNGTINSVHQDGSINHSATLHTSMSGGPLLNDKGQVVGINFSLFKKNGEHITNNAVNSTELLQFLQPLSASGNVEDLVILESNPDSFIYRIQAHLGNSELYEIAIVILCLVVGIASLVTVLIILFHPNNDDDMEVETKQDQFYTGTDEPTASVAVVTKCSGPSLLFTGKDSMGHRLRFRIPLEELRDAHQLIIGRQSDSAIQLAYPEVSRRHAALIYEEDTRGNVFISIRDAQSSHTTQLNGTPLREKCILKDGDKITIANVTLTFSFDRG